MSPGFIVWFTGLSGAGKSTLAALISDEIRARGIHVECLDGDEVRKNLSWGLGFSQEDRNRNVERIGYVARMVARSGACAITAAISPYRAVRDGIRAQSDRFVEVYCECPISVLSDRDPKGLYKRALAGEIKNFTGVDDPYEAPENADVHLRTDQETPEECASKIVNFLEEQGYLACGAAAQQALPAPYGGELTDAPLERAGQAECLEVNEQTAALFKLMAAGYLSPVRGFMTQREASRVQKGQRLERGLPWELPILLEVDDEHEPNLLAGKIVALSFQGKYLGKLQVQQAWRAPLASESTAPLRIAGVILSICPERKLPKFARALRRETEEAARSHVVGYFALPGDAARSLQLLALAAASDVLFVFAEAQVLAQIQSALGPEAPYAEQIVYVPIPAATSPALRTVIAQNAGVSRLVAELP